MPKLRQAKMQEKVYQSNFWEECSGMEHTPASITLQLERIL